MTDPDPAICHSWCSHAAAGLETVFWVEYMRVVGLVLAVAVVLQAEVLMIDPCVTLHQFALANYLPSCCHRRCHALIGPHSHCCLVLGIALGEVAVGQICGVQRRVVWEISPLHPQLWQELRSVVGLVLVKAAALVDVVTDPSGGVVVAAVVKAGMQLDGCQVMGGVSLLLMGCHVQEDVAVV